MLVYQLMFLVAVIGVVSVFAKVLFNSPITIPMVCLAAGVLAWLTSGVPGAMTHDLLTVAAEVTLAIVLFSDAANIKVVRLTQEASWSARMLGIGMPVAFVIGGLIAFVLFPELGVWQALLLAALLLPTDAALGASLFNNEKVPRKVRDAILTESGLNDGLALPLIVFLACGAIGGQHDLAQDSWLLFALKQIGFGVIVGIVLGAIGGLIVNRAVTAGLAETHHAALFALALIAGIYLAAQQLGGNSFVAVFCGGIAFGARAGSAAHASREFLETDGLLLTMLSFIYIGAIIVPEGLASITLPIVIIVVLSVFVVRPLAIVLAMVGTKADFKTRLFLGWFGPRGLATALFALFVIFEFRLLSGTETILSVTALAVALSTVLHGISSHWAHLVFERD